MKSLNCIIYTVALIQSKTRTLQELAWITSDIRQSTLVLSIYAQGQTAAFHSPADHPWGEDIHGWGRAWPQSWAGAAVTLPNPRVSIPLCIQASITLNVPKWGFPPFTIQIYSVRVDLWDSTSSGSFCNISQWCRVLRQLFISQRWISCAGWSAESLHTSLCSVRDKKQLNGMNCSKNEIKWKYVSFLQTLLYVKYSKAFINVFVFTKGNFRLLLKQVQHEVSVSDILQFQQFWLVHPFDAPQSSLPEWFPGCLEQGRQKLQIGDLKPGGRMEHGGMSSRWGNRKWQTARRSRTVIYDRVKPARGRRGNVQKSDVTQGWGHRRVRSANIWGDDVKLWASEKDFCKH